MSRRILKTGLAALCGWLLLVDVATPVPALAQTHPKDMPFRVLDGYWRGPGLELRIDYDNLLANTDPKKPFQREILRIRNRTGSMFIFSVGERQFIAIVDGPTMRISGDGLTETQTLIKQGH